MMKLVYKLQAEEFKFEIPVIHLPVRTIPLYQRPSIQPVILANTVSPFLFLTLTFYLSHFRFPSPLCPQPPIVPGSNKGLYPGRGPAWLSSVPQQAAPSSDWSLEPNTGSEYPSFMFTHVSSHITMCHSRQASSTFLQILLSFTCFTLPPASSNQGWVCLILTVIIIMMMMITVIWTASLTLVIRTVLQANTSAPQTVPTLSWWIHTWSTFCPVKEMFLLLLPLSMTPEAQSQLLHPGLTP